MKMAVLSHYARPSRVVRERWDSQLEVSEEMDRGLEVATLWLWPLPWVWIWCHGHRPRLRPRLLTFWPFWVSGRMMDHRPRHLLHS